MKKQGGSMASVAQGAAAAAGLRAAPHSARSPIAIAVTLALSGAALAQSPEKEQEIVGEAVVTGSRIQQSSGMETPTPVAALSANEIADMAPGSLTEAMAQLPQFY